MTTTTTKRREECRYCGGTVSPSTATRRIGIAQAMDRHLAACPQAPSKPTTTTETPPTMPAKGRAPRRRNR